MSEINGRNPKGMTLVEMLVAISIFTIGIAGFTMLFYRSWKSNASIIEEGMASTQATQAVRRIAAQLRDIRQSESGEYMIKSADEGELVIYRDEDNDGGIERVRYFLDGDAFRKGAAEYVDGAYPADYSEDEIVTVANYVVNSENAEPLFRYYDHSNGELVSPAVPTDIRLIEVNLWVNIKPLSAPDNIRIGTTVEIRNFDESI